MLATKSSGGEAISFLINNFSKIGEYDLSTPEYKVFYYSAQETFKCTEGVLNITRYDSNILSGTFFFTARDTSNKVVKIESGRFDINLLN
jgi:hypothetical protein